MTTITTPAPAADTMDSYLPLVFRHVNRYATTDSCRLHGIGVTPCRICLNRDRIGSTHPRHRAV